MSVYKDKKRGTWYFRVYIEDKYGIKKQKCAKSIFNSAINNTLRTTNKTFRGKNLTDKVEKTLENYHENKLKIKDLLVLKL